MKHYFVGGGVGALAGAAFLIRDADVAGADITIYEKHPKVFGGALDGARLPDGSYSLRGGRMLSGWRAAAGTAGASPSSRRRRGNSRSNTHSAAYTTSNHKPMS